MTKATTNDYLQLKIRDIAQTAIGHTATLTWTRNGYQIGQLSIYRDKNRLMMDYRCNGEPMQYPVKLLSTPCNYGGSRLWFECPQCRRRVGVLYGCKVFSCRYCKNLNYPSTRQPAAYNALDKAKRLLGKIDPLNIGIPYRPKGMHHKTYKQLYQRWHEAERQADEMMAEKLGIIQRKLDNLQH